MSDALKPILKSLSEGETLSTDAATALFDACLSGQATEAQIASALTSIAIRGETITELTACARVMMAHVEDLALPFEVLDVCGTGGDGLHTLNISTATAFVLAGCGVKIAKHGNRAITSKSGTADVLEALGVNLNATRSQQRKAIEKAHICFMFAPHHHGAMRAVGSVRRSLGFRTLFNLLGPLTNPAKASRQLMGVPNVATLRPVAETLCALGTTKSWVVHGDGLDELSTAGPNSILQIQSGQISPIEINPEALGLAPAKISDLLGAEPEYNAQKLKDLLHGEKSAYRDIVLLNAAAGLVVNDRVSQMHQGIELAMQSIDNGWALNALESLISLSQDTTVHND